MQHFESLQITLALSRHHPRLLKIIHTRLRQINETAIFPVQSLATSIDSLHVETS